VPVLPEFQRGRAQTFDTDPLRYLRGVLTFFLGSGAVIALVLGLTGLAPKALLLAGLLWTLLGILTGVVDLVLEPLGELAGGALARLGFGGGRTDSGAAEIRAGLTLASHYEHELHEPGRALAELQRLIDRYPERRQTVQLRRRLAELRARHFPSPPA